MTVSYAYDNRIECPECNTTFAEKTWIIVDSQERPDLWERCRIDSIHCYLCPPGHAHRIQDPLLLHDSFSNRLLFSPSKVSSREQASADSQALVEQAMPTLPQVTRDHLEERLQIVDRDMLPLAMANVDPEVIASVEQIFQMLSGAFDPSQAAERIELSEHGLSMFTREHAPTLWGTFVSRLATYVQNDPRGDHGANVEEALRLRNSVISTFLEHEEPIRLALEYMNLGTLYAERVRERPSENRDQAIALIEQSLEVFLPRLFPDYCTTGYYNLGILFLRTGGAYLAEDTERAIAAFEEGARSITPASNPKKWGDIHHNLGIAYHRRIRGDPAQNQGLAVAAYEEALKVRTVAAVPHDWVLTQMDMGNALLERTSGELAENIELAIEAYSSAAALSRQNGYDVDWARLHCDLCHAYLMRVRGTREENVQESIRAGRLALTVLTRERFPDEWGNTQQNLGNAYLERARAGYHDEIEQAIEAYTAALGVRSPERSQHPERSAVDWVTTLDNLSAAYTERVIGEPAANQELSIQLMEQAASIDLRELAPRAYARFLVNLGSAYRDRQSGEAEQNRKKATEAFESAIELATEQHAYADLRRAVLRLALLRIEAGQWEQAYQELTNAAYVLDQTYASAITDEGKESQSESNWFVHQMLSEVCLHVSQTREAFLSVEEGRSRVLRDALAILPIPPPAAPGVLIDEERDLLHRARQLDLTIRNTQNAEQRAVLTPEVEQTRVKLEKIWAQLSHNPDGAEYVGLRRGEPLSWDQLQSWLRTRSQPTALVEYVDLRNRLVAFVVRTGWDEPQVVDLPIRQADLLELTSAYAEGLRDPRTTHPEAAMQAGRELGLSLVDPLQPHLAGVTSVRLVPDGLLHYIPFHALERDGNPMLETVSIGYASSAAVAIRGDRSKALDPAIGETVVVGNPIGDLPFAEVEAAAVARRLGTSAIIGKAASKQHVMQKLQRAAAAHVATHAYFDPGDPFASGIVLADGEVMQAREAMQLKLQLNVLVLSACDTGVQVVNASNSLTGFARAFLYAGVRSLVVTMWPVNDLSTMLVMNEFYSGVDQGLPIIDALRRAQLWLRNATAAEISSLFAREMERSNEEAIMPYDRASNTWRRLVALEPGERPFRHPHYWAPFFVTGGI